MKRFSIPLVLALAALSLLSAGTPAHAGERPIRAEGWGVLLAGDSDYYSPHLLGSGKGEHLGPCGLDIYLHTNELWAYGNVVPTAIMLTAANGDRLVGLVDAEFDPETGIIAATITFRGGTGRFEDASGSASLLIVPASDWFYDDGYPNYGYPIDGTQFAWALEGTIDY